MVILLTKIANELLVTKGKVRKGGSVLLRRKLREMQGTKILVIGDLGLDEYVSGDVRRISPEAPVPVLEVNGESRRLGLSGNVAQNIKSLGGEAVFVAVAGDDAVAGQVEELLRREKVDPRWLIKDASRPTTRKLRVLTGHHHIVRIDFEKRRFLSAEIENRVIDNVHEVIGGCDGVILQDYAKGMLSEGLIQRIVALARESHKPVLVDPHRATPLPFYKGADLIKPNFDEAVILTGYPIDALTHPKDVLDHLGRNLREAVGASHAVVTRGKEGMSLFSEQGRKDIATVAKQVFDVTGAGDTVIAAIALAWCSGLNLEEACQIANHAAGIVVSKIGCVPCELAELEEAMSGAAAVSN